MPLARVAVLVALFCGVIAAPALWHVGRADAPLRIAIQAAPGSNLDLVETWKDTAESFAPPEFTHMQFAFFYNWTIANHLEEEFLTVRGYQPHMFVSLASRKAVREAQSLNGGADFVSFPPSPNDPVRAETCAIGHQQLVRTARWLCETTGNRCAPSPRNTDWITNEVYFSELTYVPMAFTISPVTSFVETLINISFGNEFRTKQMLEYLATLVPRDH